MRNYTKAKSYFGRSRLRQSAPAKHQIGDASVAHGSAAAPQPLKLCNVAPIAPKKHLYLLGAPCYFIGPRKLDIWTFPNV